VITQPDVPASSTSTVVPWSSKAVARRSTETFGPRSDLEPWQIRFARAVVGADLALLSLCTGTGVAVELSSHNAAARFAGSVAGAVAAVFVLAALILVRAWEPGVLGTGPTEFRRLGRAVSGSAILLGMGGLALEIASVRLWVFGVLPAFGVLALCGRYGLRRWLHRERRNGRCLLPVLVVGTSEAVADLVRRTRRDEHFGWIVRGACTPTGSGPEGSDHIAGVPVVGDLASVNRAVRDRGYRVVAVAPAPGWGPRRLHELAWQLEGSNTELVVEPGLMEIAGPRLHITPVDGLPLVRLTQPRFSGGRRLLKNGIDRVGAAFLLLLFSPILVSIAIAVRSDGGSAFYRQRRVGVNGDEFNLIKFRSMRVGADQEVRSLAARNDGDGPLFKMRVDPRVTRVGAVLRRYSLDELPQLINVLTGSMSLVGPRPPLPHEVQTYGQAARRRLLVRPGMTGLWQVSGRSDLSWDETVRLDLRYVENWSVALDLMILWKTVHAVLGGRGAY
jgi:exopolysaccharide biosynthesis polyprenyl glycosylphosphotransferase